MWTADAEMNCQQLSRMIKVNKKVLIEEFFFSTLERNIFSKLQRPTEWISNRSICKLKKRADLFGNSRPRLFHNPHSKLGEISTSRGSGEFTRVRTDDAQLIFRHFQLPAAAPETKDPTYKASTLSVLEVSDPKVCILAHLMSPLEPLDPLLESPLSHPLIKQRAVASELLNEVY